MVLAISSNVFVFTTPRGLRQLCCQVEDLASQDVSA